MLLTLPAMSRDFTYEHNGTVLTYTVISETDRTCMTKAGNDYPQTPGNDVSGSIVVPATVNDGQFDYTVTKIGENAFIRCDGLVSVTLPATISEIDGWAFAYCYNLDEVNIPSSVIKIDSHAFFFCNLSSGVTIPASVAEIGEAAFGSCEKLKEINVADGNASFTSENGVLYNKDKTIILQYPAGKAGEFEIPSSVRRMANSVFIGAGKVRLVVIPEGVTEISRSAFHDCTSLISVVIPNTVTSIGLTAFAGCKSLVVVKIPASVSQIARLAFSGCASLERITVDEANEYFSSADGVLCNKEQTTLIAFPAGKSERYIIPNTVRTIGYCAFYVNEKLKHITFISQIETIEEYAFGSCDLTEIFCDEGVQPVSCPESVFSEDTYLNARLVVPEGEAEKFKAISPWNKFANIEEWHFGGIEDTVAEPSVAPESEIYTLGGVRVGNTTDALPAGVYIKVTGNTASKVFVK